MPNLEDFMKRPIEEFWASKPSGVSSFSGPRAVEDVRPEGALKSPKVGESIDKAGCRYVDMVFGDGSPRILTYAQLSSLDPTVRAEYVPGLSPMALSVLSQNQPDVIAWTSY